VKKPISTIILFAAFIAKASAVELVVTPPDTGVNCGAIQSITATETQVDIVTTGDCGGGDTGLTTPVVIKEFTGGAVVAGSFVSVDPTDGAIVTGPGNIAVEIVPPLPSLPGASVEVRAPNDVVYNAPAKGSITDTTTDSFGFRLTDSTGRSDTGVVKITVIP